VSIYRPTKFTMFLTIVYCAPSYVSANPYDHLQASAWGGVYSSVLLTPPHAGAWRWPYGLAETCSLEHNKQ
jgi:hypothetical protein